MTSAHGGTTPSGTFVCTQIRTRFVSAIFYTNLVFLTIGLALFCITVTTCLYTIHISYTNKK
jgi:hypothetical protein